MTQPPLRPAAQAPPSARSGKSGRTRWPWVVAGVLVVIALGSGAYAMSSAGDKPAAKEQAAPAESVDVVALDRTVTDGAFVVKVTGLRCGVKDVGPDELREHAKGEFCLVDVSAQNSGKEAQLLDGSVQRAFDAQGKAYVADEQAVALLNTEGPTLLEEIAPGATVRGVLPFDVPAGTRLSALVLHESAESRGARVSLT